MAPAKRSSPRKRPDRQPVSPPPSPPMTRNALRRSTRVQKKTADRLEPAERPELLSAAKLLHDNIKKAIEQKNEKRVSFDKNAAEQLQKSQRVPSVIVPRRVSVVEPVVHEQVIYPPSRIHIPSPEQTIPQNPANRLPPGRAASLRNLIASDILAGNNAVRKSNKRNQDDTQQDEDLQTRQPSKRRKDSHANPNRTIRQLPVNPTEYTLAQLHDHPRVLSLTEISSVFLIIQDRIFGSLDGQNIGFSEKYFSFNLTPAQCAAWPLHELRTKYVPLYMNARYLADGSQYGWRSFFTQPQTRQHLVSAILGEWFVQRIFKHTAFGFPQHLVDTLEDKDREYLHHDAVVRSKERAKLLKAWYDDWRIWPTILDATNAAATDLADELLTVLQPLLPPTLFNPLESSPVSLLNTRRSIVINATESQKQRLHNDIKRDLINLILDCTALHKGIRLTGEDGTIVRISPMLEKGSQFHPTAPVYCVNQLQCNQTCPTDPKEKSELCIKMTCFPRVEATVPEGPDMQELGEKEVELRQKLAEEAEREAEMKQQLADEASQNLQSQPQPSPSPKSLSPAKDTRRVRMDHHDRDNHTHNHTHNHNPSSRRPSHTNLNDPDTFSDDEDDDPFTWDTHSDIWPIVPPSLQDKAGLTPGLLDPETNEINTVKRAAYVTIYPHLTPARVYCEWTPQPYTIRQTLEAAVADARSIHPQRTRLRVEDMAITAWNAWAVYGGLAQWGVLAGAVVVGVCRALSIPSHVQNLLVRVVEGVGRVVKRASPVAAVPPENVPGIIAEQVGVVLRTVYDASGPFGLALTGPVETLVMAPLAAVYRFLAGRSVTMVSEDEVARVVKDVVSAVPASLWDGQKPSLVGGEAVVSPITAVAVTTLIADVLTEVMGQSNVDVASCGTMGLQGTDCVSRVSTSITETTAADGDGNGNKDVVNVATGDDGVQDGEDQNATGSSLPPGKSSKRVLGVVPGWLRWQ